MKGKDSFEERTIKSLATYNKNYANALIKNKRIKTNLLVLLYGVLFAPAKDTILKAIGKYFLSFMPYTTTNNAKIYLFKSM